MKVKIFGGKVVSLFLVICFMIVATISGCGPKGEKGNEQQDNGNTVSTNNNGEKTLRYGTSGEFVSLDPALIDDVTSANVINNIFEGLTRYKNGTMEIEPGLASSWDISADGKIYTFNLRKDVKFHDGTAFNADAVKFSIERCLPPQKTEEMVYSDFTFGMIEKVEKVDEYTVKIFLKNAYAPFLKNLAMSYTAPIVSSEGIKRFGEDFGKNPVGTGPFKFVKWVDNEILLEKNNEYWGEKAKVDKLSLKSYSDSKVRTQELIDEKLDVADTLLPEHMGNLEANKIPTVMNSMVRTSYFGFNCRNGVFADAKMRQVVAHLVDRNEMIKQIFNNYSEPANTVLPPSIEGHNNQIKPYEYDIEKSKKLLAETGKSVPKLKLYCPENSNTGKMALEYLKNQLAKIGIDSVVTIMPSAELIDLLGTDDWSIFYWGWTSDNGDADNFMFLFETDGEQNDTKYSNSKFDELVKKARLDTNKQDTIKLYEETEAILARDIPWIPLFHETSLSASSRKVKNFRIAPNDMINFNLVDIQ
jgi:peptide/nickel transport system substrate-binding protein